MKKLEKFVATKDIDTALIFSDGKCFLGCGAGSKGKVVGEICFNVAMTGYQETLTDPSYYGQIINFSYPHIGNVGINDNDNEKLILGAKGLIIRNKITAASNYRSQQNFDEWLQTNKLTAIYNVDTREITHYVRKYGAKMVAIIYVNTNEVINIKEIAASLKSTPNLLGTELASKVSSHTNLANKQKTFDLIQNKYPLATHFKYKVVAIDFGIKLNILKHLAAINLDVVTVHAQTTFEQIMAYNPDGVFLSNGPADPFAVYEYAGKVIKQLLDVNMPIFGICLGHQLLSIASGLDTIKMKQGHRGINHPVKNLVSGKVEITSQNHGFCSAKIHVPDNIEVTHVSLFDNTIAGIKRLDKPAFSIQYHPESSPGPHDSFYLFKDFVSLIKNIQ